MLPRSRRLPRTGFRALARARRVESPHFKVAYARTAAQGGRAVVISKKAVAGAAARNLLKRRITPLLSRLVLPGALVVYVKPGAGLLSAAALHEELSALFATLR